ncbi:MAG: Calx-beta domain-containing protein [Vicinamibacteria bacterium]
MRLTRVALGTVTLGLMTAVAATALENNDSARAALFEVTAPDSAVTWTAGRFQTVTWNVAGSKAAPVNAAAVRISLSVDGGATFPLVLAASTANDGSESVPVPSGATTRARLKVEAVGNRFFFDVSDADFTIVGGTGPDASVGDASVAEGNAGTTPVGVPVSLSAASASAVTVNFTTAPGTATAPSDYAIATGTLTFAPGETTRTVTLSVVGDTTVEPHESFFLNISNLSGGGTITDATGEVTILNDDGAATLSIADDSTVEGNSGPTDAHHAVTLSAVSASAVTVDFATADGTATAGTDYTATSGTLTFAPGTAVRNVTVSITGETVVEPDETYFVNLTNAVGATILDAQGVGTIVNDDGAAGADQTGELSHGFRITEDLASAGGNPDVDTFAISQKPYSSYEVVVDATSGDITPVGLDLTDGGTTVLGTSVAIGTSQSRSLRFQNTSSTDVDTQEVRVQSGDCTTNCGTDDTYRLRAYETTSAIPRFNNSATQVTVLLLQNPTDYTIATRLYFWDVNGVLLHTEAVTLTAKNLLVFNTSTIPTLLGVSGTVTVTHDGRYGDLAGKGVALEPATGFSFDSPMVPRAR